MCTIDVDLFAPLIDQQILTVKKVLVLTNRGDIDLQTFEFPDSKLVTEVDRPVYDEFM